MKPRPQQSKASTTHRSRPSKPHPPHRYNGRVNDLDDAYLERLNGADLYFEVVGPEDAPTLIYLHGGPGYNSYSFRALVGESLQDYRVVYLDGRGGGRSGSLAETEQGEGGLTLDTLADDVEAVRAFLKAEKITPLGHGFGALIALEYARRHPLTTDRVIAVNPWLHLPELALTLLREAAALRGTPLDDPADEVRARTPEGQYPQVGAARVEAAFALLNARDLLNALEFTDASSRMRLEFADAEGQLLGGAEVQQALVSKGLWEFEYPPFIEQIKRPIFVIAGAQDRTSYPEQVEWLADLAGAEVEVLPAGHYPWLDDEDGFVAALEDALRR